MASSNSKKRIGVVGAAIAAAALGVTAAVVVPTATGGALTTSVENPFEGSGVEYNLFDIILADDASGTVTAGAISATSSAAGTIYQDLNDILAAPEANASKTTYYRITNTGSSDQTFNLQFGNVLTYDTNGSVVAGASLPSGYDIIVNAGLNGGAGYTFLNTTLSSVSNLTYVVNNASGTLIVPAGDFVVLAITTETNVNLDVDANAGYHIEGSLAIASDIA